MRELARLRVGGARHARELVVELEVVLERDGREGLVLLLDADALLRLDRLMEPFRPTPAFEDPAGELVDDLHLAVLDHVVDVTFEELLAAKRGLQLMDEVLVDVVVEVGDAERLLDAGDALFGGDDGAFRLVDLVVAIAGQPAHDASELHVEIVGVVGAARDDERSARLVDQDRVDLVDDREEVPALHLLLLRAGHVVAEVVESELVVRAVGDVGRVGAPLLVPVVDRRGRRFRSSSRGIRRLAPIHSASRVAR